MGAYLGYYSFSIFEVQPTGRLLWMPSRQVSIWAAVSRAVRTPELLELGGRANITAVPMPPLVGIVRLTGNPLYRSEPAVSYETGQRIEASRRVSLDFSEFFTLYHRLDSEVPEAPSMVYGGATGPTYFDIPYSIQNARYGRSYGGEASVSFAAARRWTLTGGYSWLHLATYLYSPQSQGSPTQGEQGSPRNQWELRTHLDLTRHLEWDAALYFYGRMTAVGMPANLRADTHVAWHWGEHAEFVAGVQDAFNPTQPEYYSARLRTLTEVHRNVFGAFTWRF
jgi:iron complex outermembrane receptor protein